MPTYHNIEHGNFKTDAPLYEERKAYTIKMRLFETIFHDNL